MGVFDEQIHARKTSDQENFVDSIYQIAGAVMGRRISDALNDDRRVTTDAIGDVLKYYRVKSTEVPEEITDMNDVLEYLLRPHGIMRRNVRLDKHWDRQASGAMLTTRKDDGTVIALIPLGVNHYRFYDHKNGKMVLIDRHNRDLVSEEAIAFYKPFPLKELDIRSLIRYIIDQIAISDIIYILIAMLASTLVGFTMPWLNNVLFSDVIEKGSYSMLLGAAIFMVCATLSSLLFNSLRNLLSARITIKLNVNVHAATMMRILSLPANFFRDYSAGELSNRAGYMTQLCRQIVDSVLTTGMTAVFSLGYIAQLLTYAPSLTVPALLMMLLTVTITIITIFVQMKVTRQAMLETGKESGVSYSLISGIQKIRLTGSEKRAFARWGKVYSKEAALSYNPPFFLKISSVITMAISLIGTMILYGVAIRSGVSVAEYYSFNTAFGSISGAFSAVVSIATVFANIKPMLDMLKPFLETKPEVSENKTVVTRVTGEIELNGITFAYKEFEPPILDDLNLKIKAGQYVAIVGKTGAGKSTLLRLMLGFESPLRGSVYYDGYDLKNIDLRSLRRKIGTVLQNGKLFNGDIYSNIVVTAPWLTMDEAWEAAEIAGIAEDIRMMPMQMQTVISEGSGGISGGQRQRLMIARAIAPKPKILFFDEATSALDNVTQKKISDALEGLNCTRIVIAHRLSTIRQCDRILVLDKGKIVEDGTYEELIAENGIFADLVARQQLDIPETKEE